MFKASIFYETKKKKTTLNVSSAAVVIGALKVKIPFKIAANNILRYFFLLFLMKVRLDMSCELSA